MDHPRRDRVFLLDDILVSKLTFATFVQTAVERIWHITDSQGLEFQVKVLKIFSTDLALRRAQRIEREVSEAEEARAACAQGSRANLLSRSLCARKRHAGRAHTFVEGAPRRARI